ncbi:MAG: N-acetylneuraminate synthase [Planctomycetota bacterium]
MDPDVYLIAEAGVNHNGSPERALELVDVAADCGADAVKFQAFDASELATADAALATYQAENLGADDGQLAMLRTLELGPDAMRAVRDRCAARGIAFLCTAFDLASLDLVLELGVDLVKTGSGDLTFAPLLHRAARSGLPLVVSTGMATLGDVEDALAVVAHGLVRDGAPTGFADCEAAYASAEGRAALAERVTLLHCVSDYPAPPESVNLAAMDVLRDAFGLRVGFSDHTLGTAVAIAAVGRGATTIEKHFTLDRTLEGPDHAASLEPAELRALVAGCRDAARARGVARKQPQPSERETRERVRRSIVAARDVAAGQALGPDDLACKRPAGGVSPMRFWDVAGTPAPRDLRRDERL